MMAQCDRKGCFLNLLTNGFDFKESTTDKSRGSVKGIKCGRSATFGKCMQKGFSLGITEELMLQTKESKATPMTPAPGIVPEELWTVAIKGRNYLFIAMIAESITATMNTVKAMNMQAEVN